MAQGLSRVVEEARRRRDEAASRLERVRELARPEPEQQPVQGPNQRIERPSLKSAQNEVQHVTYDKPYTGVPRIHSREQPVYTPDDSTKYHQETNTVTLLDEPRVRFVQDRPPRPNVMPEITPVAALKNQVARENEYSDKARSVLNKTPTQVRYSPFDKGERTGGYYQPPTLNEWLWPVAMLPEDMQRPFRTVPKPQIVLANQDSYTRAEDVLAHEFAHKWYYEQLPSERQGEWYREWNNDLVSPWTKDRTIGRSDVGDNPHVAASEAYAHQAELGPMALSSPDRGYWYPGMYKTGLGEYVLPPVVAIESQNRTPFSAEHWVNEYEAPLGYYEDGSAVRSPLPYPRQWEKPQWPSLKGYQIHIPDVYGARG